MKQKLLGGVSAALLTLSVLAAPAAAAPRAVPVTVDGTRLSGAGYVENGVTAVPLRTLLESVGGWEVQWDGKYGQAVAVSGSAVLTAKPGERAVTVNGGTRSAPAPVYLLDGRTYVPLRAVGEALGWDVAWDAALGGAAVATRSAGPVSASPAEPEKAPSRPAAPEDPEDPAEEPSHSVGASPEDPAEASNPAGWTEEDLYWLSRVISAESGGEVLRGQIAVGNVVMNRVRSREFPDTIREVVFDARDAVQFEPVSNGTIYDAPTARSVEAAKAVLNGAESVVGESLYFYAPALSPGVWINENRTYCTTIGCHRFYL